MSQENVERLRAAVEAFLVGTGESDREGMLTRVAEAWDPEIEWDASELPLPDLARVVRGREAVRRWWGDFLGAWETTRFEYELVESANRVVVLLDQQMRGRSTGIEVALGKYALTNTFVDGLVVHMKMYMSQTDALEAVGLSE